MAAMYDGHTRLVSVGRVLEAKPCATVRHSAAAMMGNSGSACFVDFDRTDKAGSSRVAGIRTYFDRF
jgi:hypothetical protein